MYVYIYLASRLAAGTLSVMAMYISLVPDHTGHFS